MSIVTKIVKIDEHLSLRFKEFQLDSMCENPAIIMIAKRGSGKSWICRAILRHFKSIPVGIIISPTEKLSEPFYSDFLPDSYIHYEYKTETIVKLLKRQVMMIDKQLEKQKACIKIDPRAFILMDDCLASKGKWMKDQPIQELLFNGRHYKIMYMLTMQFPLGITPELRGNFDYIFLLKDDVYSNKKRIYDHYAGIFPTFQSFLTVFSELTLDYCSMVIVNRGIKDDFIDKVFWFKAQNEKIGTIGCEQLLQHHTNNYNEDWKNVAKRRLLNNELKKPFGIK